MTDQGDLKEDTITQEEIDAYRKEADFLLSYQKQTPEELFANRVEVYKKQVTYNQEIYSKALKEVNTFKDNMAALPEFLVARQQLDVAKLKKTADIAKIAYSQAQAELKYIQKYPKSQEFIQQLERDIEASKTKILTLEKDPSSSAAIDPKKSTLSPKNLELYNQYKLLVKAKTFYDDTIKVGQVIGRDDSRALKEKSQECTVELDIIKKAEPIKELCLKHDVEENKKIFITNKESDEAAIVYYNSLDKLEDFYKTEKERHKENPGKLKEYDIKLYDLQAEILQNRADELKSQGRRDSSKEAEGRSILAREYANKLNRSQIKEEKTKEANAKANSFLGDIRNQQADFIDDLSTNKNLGPNQKKGKFLAQFLKQSVEIYVNNYYSGGNLHLKDQLQSLLINNGDTDIDMAIKGIKDNLPKYINQMNDTIGKELGKYSPALPTKGEISPERTQLIQKVKENSLYVITAKKINEVVEQTTKLTAEEKQHFASSAIIKTLYSVINYFSGNKKSQQYPELKLDEKSPAITKSSPSISSLLYSPIKNWKMSSKVQGITNSLKQIGISDVAGIKDIHRPGTTPSKHTIMERSSGDFTDDRSSIRSSINSVDFHDTRSSERNSRGG
ncbi:MAG: hypothetical protein WBJ81_01030 [Rickettsiales bacterium]